MEGASFPNVREKETVDACVNSGLELHKMQVAQCVLLCQQKLVLLPPQPKPKTNMTDQRWAGLGFVWLVETLVLLLDRPVAVRSLLVKFVTSAWMHVMTLA